MLPQPFEHLAIGRLYHPGCRRWSEGADYKLPFTRVVTEPVALFVKGCFSRVP